MDADLYRCFWVMGLAILVSLPFALLMPWVHKEYQKRKAEHRAPRWLYRLECFRSAIGRDKAEGRPEPSEPDV